MSDIDFCSYSWTEDGEVEIGTRVEKNSFNYIPCYHCGKLITPYARYVEFTSADDNIYNICSSCSKSCFT